MSDLSEVLHSIFGDDDKKVKRIVPMHPDWDKKAKELVAIQKEIEQLERKRKHLKQRFWTTIEDDLQCYDDMRYNNKDNTIEVLSNE